MIFSRPIPKFSPRRPWLKVYFECPYKLFFRIDFESRSSRREFRNWTVKNRFFKILLSELDTRDPELHRSAFRSFKCENRKKKIFDFSKEKYMSKQQKGIQLQARKRFSDNVNISLPIWKFSQKRPQLEAFSREKLLRLTRITFTT